MLGPRYGEDRYLRSHLPQFPNGLYTVLCRHHNVGDHERRKMFSAQSKTLNPVVCLPDLVPRAHQGLRHDIAVASMIIYDKYVCHFGTCRDIKVGILKFFIVYYDPHIQRIEIGPFNGRWIGLLSIY